jgi:uncharacterized protein YbjQ (UPF0145 family)
MSAPNFLWSTGDVPPGYEVITIGWAEAETMSEAAGDLRKYTDKQGADGVVAVRFVPVTQLVVSTKERSFGTGIWGDVNGRSTTRWVAYGTLVKLR